MSFNGGFPFDNQQRAVPLHFPVPFSTSTNTNEVGTFEQPAHPQPQHDTTSVAIPGPSEQDAALIPPHLDARNSLSWLQNNRKDEGNCGVPAPISEFYRGEQIYNHNSDINRGVYTSNFCSTYIAPASQPIITNEESNLPRLQMPEGSIPCNPSLCMNPGPRGHTMAEGLLQGPPPSVPPTDGAGAKIRNSAPLEMPSTYVIFPVEQNGVNRRVGGVTPDGQEARSPISISMPSAETGEESPHNSIVSMPSGGGSSNDQYRQGHKRTSTAVAVSHDIPMVSLSGSGIKPPHEMLTSQEGSGNHNGYHSQQIGAAKQVNTQNILEEQKPLQVQTPIDSLDSGPGDTSADETLEGGVSIPAQKKPTATIDPKDGGRGDDSVIPPDKPRGPPRNRGDSQGNPSEHSGDGSNDREGRETDSCCCCIIV